MMVNIYWLVVEPPTPLKNDGVKVSWDVSNSQYDGNNNPAMFQTINHGDISWYNGICIFLVHICA